jgi:hypothetical protein
MTPKHDEIIKQLGDGWSMAWDTTEIDEDTRRAINRVIADMSDDLREILAEAFRDAKIDITLADQRATAGIAGKDQAKSSASTGGTRTAQKTGTAAGKRTAKSRTASKRSRAGRTSRSRRTAAA